jgi:cytidylate kinase
MAATLKLVGQQLGLWELKRRLEDLGQRPGRCIEGDVAYGPCLLISRQPGSLGARIARLAGDLMGWHVFDHAVLDEIARGTEIHHQLLGSVDDATRTKLTRSWHPELEVEDTKARDYLKSLRQVVLTLGHHGDIVIVGRGASFILPSKCALRVRVVAPFDLRVKRVVEADRIPFADARERIEKFDSTRASFVQEFFGRDINAATNFDLVINTADIGIEAATEMVLVALKNKLGVRPKGL